MTVSEKQEKKRKEIAMAVRDFIINNPNYDDITVDEICNATGIAKGTFYHYFTGKDNLMDQIMYPIDDFFNTIEGDLLKCGSFLEAIKQYSESYGTYIATSGIKMCKTVILAMLSSNNSKYVSRERDIVNILYKIIEHWQNEGEVTEEYTAQKICDMFVVVLRGYILNWYTNEGSYNLSEAIVLHTHIMAKSFLK